MLYKTRTTPGRVLKSRAVHQGQPRIKRGVCLALVGALELISAADWNILISLLNLGLRDSDVKTRLLGCQKKIVDLILAGFDGRV